MNGKSTLITLNNGNKMPALGLGVNPSKKKAFPLKLKSIERRKRDGLWLRYEVVRPKTTKSRTSE